MPRQKSKGRTGLRSLEDNALLLLVFAISLAFAWILWPFFGALLWAAVLAIVFTVAVARHAEAAKPSRSRHGPDYLDLGHSAVDADRSLAGARGRQLS
jgi:hypothetical protein